MTAIPLDLSIVGTGLYCPVGLTAPTACAAMRAGLAAFHELDYVDDQDERVYGARVPRVVGTLGGRRSVALLRGALSDLQRRQIEPLTRCPAILVTGLGHSRFQQALVELMPGPLTALLSGGPGSDLGALEQAADLLNRGQARQVLICAVDCSVTARALRCLRDSGRLRTSSNPQGVLPGEAAACLLLERTRSDREGVLVSLGVGQEPALLTNDVPLRAEGLTQALRGALEAANCRMHDIDWRLCNYGDEGFFVKEQSLALARVLEAPKPTLPLWQPADTIGELGAASGFTQIIWVTQAWARRYAPGATAICMCSDPDGPRSAVVVRR